MRTSVQRGGFGLVGVLLLVVGLAVLSARLGGPVSWHITSGGSMAPGISPGTLVVVARQPDYQVGDVVAYPSAELRGQVVLHRVVDRDGERLVLQGDANSWLDPDRPLPDEALGARVVQVAGVGPLLGWLGRPGPMGAGVAMMALPFLGKERRRRRRSGPEGGYPLRALPSSGPTWTDDDEDGPQPASPAASAFRLPASGPSWDPDLDLDQADLDQADLDQAARPTPAADPANDPRPRTSPAAPTAAAVIRLRGLRVPTQVETGLLVAVAACGVLAAASTGGPLLRSSTVSSSAEHVVTWSYGAEVAPGLVYDDGVVETGETLYNRLVPIVEVTAELDVALPDGAQVTGTWRLDVVIEDESGWRRTTTTGSPAEVTSAASRLQADVRVADLLGLANQASAESGVESNGRQISVIAVLDLDVTANGGRVEAQAAPELMFLADDDKLRVAPDTALEQRGPVTLPAADAAPSVRLAGVGVPVGTARLGAGIVAGLALVALGLLRLARRDEDEDARITRTAGHLLVPMEDLQEPERTVDVRSFDALAVIAASYDRMVLYGDHEGLRVYLVLDDGVAYRYYSAEAAARLDTARQAAEPAPAEGGSTEGAPRADVPAQRTPDGDRAPR